MKRGRGRLIGRTKCGMNTKPHSICDCQGRPLYLLVTAGQVATTSACGSLPNVKWLLRDRGYDTDWFRDALQDKGIRACIPGRIQNKKTVRYPSRDIPLECTGGQWTSAALVTLLFNELPGSERDHVWKVERLAARGNLPRQIAPRSSSQPSPLQQPSSIGYES